jgi:hypothetical protein
LSHATQEERGCAGASSNIKKVRFEHQEMLRSPLNGTDISHVLVHDEHVLSTFLNKKLIIQHKKIKMYSKNLKIYQKNLCERTKMPLAV